MRTPLALPTDPAESFVREVDENLRRDQARDFLKRNGPWIIGAILLFLAAVAGWLYWQDRQQKQAEAETEKLNAVMSQIGGGSSVSPASTRRSVGFEFCEVMLSTKEGRISTNSRVFLNRI